MLDFQALTAATQSTAGQGLSGKDVPVFLWGFWVYLSMSGSSTGPTPTWLSCSPLGQPTTVDAHFAILCSLQYALAHPRTP